MTSDQLLLDFNIFVARAEPGYRNSEAQRCYQAAPDLAGTRASQMAGTEPGASATPPRFVAIGDFAAYLATLIERGHYEFSYCHTLFFCQHRLFCERPNTGPKLNDFF